MHTRFRCLDCAGLHHRSCFSSTSFATHLTPSLAGVWVPCALHCSLPSRHHSKDCRTAVRLTSALLPTCPDGSHGFCSCCLLQCTWLLQKKKREGGAQLVMMTRFIKHTTSLLLRKHLELSPEEQFCVLGLPASTPEDCLQVQTTMQMRLCLHPTFTFSGPLHHHVLPPEIQLDSTRCRGPCSYGWGCLPADGLRRSPCAYSSIGVPRAKKETARLQQQQRNNCCHHHHHLQQQQQQRSACDATRSTP